MKRIVFTLLLSIPLICYSQDLIILRNGDQINCKITKIDTAIIYYNFPKGEKTLSSYMAKKDIRSYQLHADNQLPINSSDKSLMQDKIIIDTTKYIKEASNWINLVTYSQRFGLYAKGWSAQYYGFN